MGYVCQARNESVNGESMVLVPVAQREVNYLNYAVSLRGGKLIKQLMKISKGFETVKEIPVSQSVADKFIVDNPPKIVDTKTVKVEYNLHPISCEAVSNAISKNNVFVYDQIREMPKQDRQPYTRQIDDEWAKDDE